MPFTIKPDDNTEIINTKLYQAVVRKNLADGALNEKLDLGYPIKINMINLFFYDNHGNPSTTQKNIDIRLTGGLMNHYAVVYEEDNHNVSYLSDYNTVHVPYNGQLNIRCSETVGLNVECYLIYERIKTQED